MSAKSTPQPTLMLDVNLTNPGQFLACCGALELASRLDPESLGWFGERQFYLATSATGLLQRFIECKVTAIVAEETGVAGKDDSAEEEKEPKSPPIMLGDPFRLRLDWWEDESASQAGFKTWSAGMTVPGFFNGTLTGKGERQKVGPSMRQHLARRLSAGVGLLDSIEAIAKPSPFNFDSRLSRNVAIDLGFVGDVAFAFSPAVELLALVGLQRFRPRMEIRWERNTYHVWRHPLPVNVAAAVAHGLMPTLCAGVYAFSIKPRDAQGRYKAFGPALLERNTNARPR